MRYFEVYLDRCIPGSDPDIAIVEVEDDASEEEINKACAEALDSLIENWCYSGWDEISEEEACIKMKNR